MDWQIPVMVVLGMMLAAMVGYCYGRFTHGGWWRDDFDVTEPVVGDMPWLPALDAEERAGDRRGSQWKPPVGNRVVRMDDRRKSPILHAIDQAERETVAAQHNIPGTVFRTMAYQKHEWEAKNPILAKGQEGICLSTHGYKRGDGVSTWLALPWLSWNPGRPIPASMGDRCFVCGGQADEVLCADAICPHRQRAAE